MRTRQDTRAETEVGAGEQTAHVGLGARATSQARAPHKMTALQCSGDRSCLVNSCYFPG